MNDICSTDYIWINLNKVIVATVVKIALTRTRSKMEKKTWLGNVEDIFVFSIFLFVKKTEIVILLL